MSDETEDFVEVEEATVYDLFAQDCVLCGGQLGPRWDSKTPRRCTNCGALIHQGNRE